MKQKNKAVTAKDQPNSWRDAFVLLALLGAIGSAGIFSSEPDRFAMLGVVSALVVGLGNANRRFHAIFLGAGALSITSFLADPFTSSLLILASEALVLIWYFSGVSWEKTRDPNDLGILITIFFSVLMFLAVDLRSVDQSAAFYLTYAFFFLKPWSWSKPKRLTDEEDRKLEFVVSVLPVFAFAHVFSVQASMELSLLAAATAGLLLILGGYIAAPTLIFLSLTHMNPAWMVFGGAIAFATFCRGWPLRLIYVLLATGYTIQLKSTDDPLFWTTAVSAVVILSVLFVREMPKAKDLKIEWPGILLTLALLGVPVYLDESLLVIDTSSFDGTTLGIAMAFAVSLTLFIFWRPKVVAGIHLSVPLWTKFVGFIQEGMRRASTDSGPQYRVEPESRSAVMEIAVAHILVWLLFLAALVLTLGGL